MKKSKTSQQKHDYEKVYEHPLNWCPLFGSLPEIKNTHLENDDVAYTTADKCLGIIESARFNLGVWDNYMVRNDRLPEVEKLPISIYHEYDEACKVVRRLFQNLDYLALKTSRNIIHGHTYNDLFKNRNSLPGEPIRNSNRYTPALTILVEDIEVIQAVRPELLDEAQKIIGEVFELKETHLYALYAILEAWLILTSLLFHNKRSEDIDDFFLFKKIYKAEKLLQYSDVDRESIEKQKFYKEKENRRHRSSIGGSKSKAKGIQYAIKEAIKIKNGNTKAQALWKYFKVNHQGEEKGMMCDQYLIYYSADESGDNPDGQLIQLNTKDQKRRSNVFKSFQYNLARVKEELKKESQ